MDFSKIRLGHDKVLAYVSNSKILTNKECSVGTIELMPVVSIIDYDNEVSDLCLIVNPEHFHLVADELFDLTEDKISSWSKDSDYKVADNILSFKDKLYTWVIVSSIAKVILAKDGCVCKSCKEFYPMAEPNQPDGTLVCYSCRSNPIRAYY